MMQRYTIVDIDCLVNRSVPDSYSANRAIVRSFAKIDYKRLLKNWHVKSDRALFVLLDEYNESLYQAYADMSDQSHAIAPCGLFSFEDMYSIGRDGLIADIDNGNVFIGHSLNWSREYFNWWIVNSAVGFDRWDGPDGFWADFGEPEREDSDIVLMKAPGYGIFGHWFLDFVPQLYLTKFGNIEPSTRFVFDHITGWMQVLLDALGIRATDAYESRIVFHRRVLRPSGVKCGFALAEPINHLAWDYLRAYFNHANCDVPAVGADRIFISRRNWQGDRKLSGYDALEDAMRSLGFTVLYPETLDLAAQAHHFSGAKIVVGEDGSALHSIMLANPGAILGILMLPDRLNLWHAGICEAAGHRLAYHRLAGEDLTAEAIREIVSFAESLLEKSA